MSEQALRQEIAELRARIEAVDDWAAGVHKVLADVLPFLLRGHPEVEKVHQLLQRQGKGAVALNLCFERAMRALLEGQACPLRGVLYRGASLSQPNLEFQRLLPVQLQPIVDDLSLCI